VGLNDFKKVLKCYRLKMTEKEYEELFNMFNKKDKADYAELLSTVIVYSLLIY